MSLVQLVGVAIKIAAEFVNHSQKNLETFFIFLFLGFRINVTGGMVVVEQNEIWF